MPFINVIKETLKEWFESLSLLKHTSGFDWLSGDDITQTTMTLQWTLYLQNQKDQTDGLDLRSSVKSHTILSLLCHVRMYNCTVIDTSFSTYNSHNNINNAIFQKTK